MIKKGTQCHYCERKHGELQKVILTKDFDGNFVCPWCFAIHPDKVLAQTIYQLSLTHGALKKAVRNLNSAQEVIKRQRKIMDIEHKCILLIQTGEVEKGLRIYADFFGGEKHETQ